MSQTVEMSLLKDIEVVIFDCDGVMFDSKAANTAYYNRILTHFNLPKMTPDQLAYVHMHTADKAIAHLFRDDELYRAAQIYRREMGYSSFIKYMTIEPHLKAFLTRLRPQYATAIATNRSDTMPQVLSEHGLVGWFDLVVTALDVPFPKPHPGQLNKILEHFKIQPAQAIFIGDSQLDEAAAGSAEVPFIAFNSRQLSAVIHTTGFRMLENIFFPGEEKVGTQKTGG
jgi:phosphoglycolate phosphatase